MSTAETLWRLAENLDEESRGQATEAIILALLLMLRTRFRRQKKAFDTAGMVLLERSLDLGIFAEADAMAAAGTVTGVNSVRFAQRYGALMQRAFEAGGKLAAIELQSSAAVAGTPPRTAATMLSQIDQTTVERVSSVIKEGFLQGTSRVELRMKVGELFRDWAGKQASNRSEMIAVNETSIAFHAGMIAAARASGPEATKTWWVDRAPCPICAGNAGETVAIDEPFSSGDQAPPVHPSCRCSLRFDAEVP